MRRGTRGRVVRRVIIRDRASVTRRYNISLLNFPSEKTPVYPHRDISQHGSNNRIYPRHDRITTTICIVQPASHLYPISQPKGTTCIPLHTPTPSHLRACYPLHSRRYIWRESLPWSDTQRMYSIDDNLHRHPVNWDTRPVRLPIVQRDNR